MSKTSSAAAAPRALCGTSARKRSWPAVSQMSTWTSFPSARIRSETYAAPIVFSWSSNSPLVYRTIRLVFPAETGPRSTILCEPRPVPGDFIGFDRNGLKSPRAGMVAKLSSVSRTSTQRDGSKPATHPVRFERECLSKSEMELAQKLRVSVRICSAHVHWTDLWRINVTTEK
jgi:hypothetical protein